jgi:hypothetical protein
MDIKLKKEENGLFTVKDKIDFSKGGSATVSVECANQGYDEVLLKKEAESYLNQQALTQGMRIEEIFGPQATIPVKVERGESARVKRLDFPVDILPQGR